MVETLNNRIQSFTPHGRFIECWGTKGTEDGAFTFPCGLAFDFDQHLVVVDCGNDRLQVFDSSNKFIRRIGEKGSEHGNFHYPSGIAIDNDGHLVVSDTGKYTSFPFP